MERRLCEYTKQPKQKTPDLSTVPVQGMFSSRPFVVQHQPAQKEQQADLKTSLTQAEHYGHHLSQVNSPDITKLLVAVQPKMEMGKLIQLQDERREKGKNFRGGSKKQRDNWYGFNDKDFQRWWHREGKEEFGGRDIDNREEAQEYFEHWISIGRPKVR